MAGMGFSFTCMAVWDLYQCSISRAEGSLSWHLPATPPGYIRRSEETWRPREELSSSNAQMHLGNPQSFLTTSSQKCNSRKQISNNKVKFSIKLFLLNFPILFTTVMLFAVALLASFYPQRALRKGKKKNCTKPRMHLLQMGFQQWAHGEGICSFCWGGEAVTVLKRRHAEEVNELVCFKTRQN